MGVPKGVIVTRFQVRETIKATQAAIHRAMRVVAQEMEEEIRATIQEPYPPASDPWSPPHRRTGRLSEGLILVGTPSGITVRTPKHGRYLEGGTEKMDPRPFIRPILFGKGNKIRWARRIAEVAKLEGGLGRKRSK